KKIATFHGGLFFCPRRRTRTNSRSIDARTDPLTPSTRVPVADENWRTKSTIYVLAKKWEKSARISRASRLKHRISARCTASRRIKWGFLPTARTLDYGLGSAYSVDSLNLATRLDLFVD